MRDKFINTIELSRYFVISILCVMLATGCKSWGKFWETTEATHCTICGNLSGLTGASLKLALNDEYDLTLNTNGSFGFSQALVSDSAYWVEVVENPAGQVCHIANNAGQYLGTAVNDIDVRCMTDSNWVQDAYLKASNAGASDQFGTSVAVSGNTIVVGANGEASNQTTITNVDGVASADNSASVAGGAYVFRRGTDGNWVQDAYLKASNVGINDQFGTNVAVSGNTIVVGALQEASSQTTITNSDGVASANNSAASAGAVYVFRQGSDGNWLQDAYLKAANAEANDLLGVSVSVSGDTIAVAATSEASNQTTITNTDGFASADNSASSAGAVYVFRRSSDGNWVQDAYLKASNAEAGDQFGQSVAVSGDMIAVGAYFEDSNQTTITNSDGVASSDNSASAAGAVYVFRRGSDGNWLQDAYLKASNAEASDQFGTSVAVSGNTLAVGANGEGSNQTTITNNDGIASADNSFAGAGAVYVFRRSSDGNWAQDAYLKAANVGPADEFGLRIALSGNTIAVGASQEDSSQTTITNSDGLASADNSATTAGAVYVFRRGSDGNWVQDAYLKASNAGAGDQFGQSVAVSGHTIVVGAHNEDSNQITITNTDGVASADDSSSNAGAVYVFKAF